MVEVLVGDQEADPVEGLGADLVVVQEAEDEAVDPECLQAYQEASRTEEHLQIAEHVLLNLQKDHMNNEHSLKMPDPGIFFSSIQSLGHSIPNKSLK